MMLNTIIAAFVVVHGLARQCDTSRTYAQCGGFSYDGETCCPEGWSCSFVSAEYSQCSMCAGAYAQCGGGPGYNGSTCCITGFNCVPKGKYYSGCEEAKGCPNKLYSTCGGKGFKGEKCCPTGSE